MIDAKLRGRLMLLTTLALLAIFVLWSSALEERIFAAAPTLDMRKEDGAIVLSWRGEVEAPMARRFEEAFAEWRGRTDRFVIELHSPGGSLAEGAAVIDAIGAARLAHRIDTRILDRESCLSMCVPIFLQGEERRAGPRSRFMFHEPTARDYFTGEVIEQPGFEQRIEAERFFQRYFENSSMDPGYAARLKERWRGRDVWTTGRDLLDEGSNVVTTLAP